MGVHKNETTSQYYNNIHSTGRATVPIQTLPDKRKTKRWKESCMDAFEAIGFNQIYDNSTIAEYRKMVDGKFTYSSVTIEDTELPWFNSQIRTLREDWQIPTYLKHFDFMGMIFNALKGAYSEFKGKFNIDSRDEYATNEFIRQKTELLHRYSQQVFMQEINKLLAMRGIDPNKQDFNSQEEQQQYQQFVQQQVQELTPPEIERMLSKNFKVLAVEWAQNTISEDDIDFHMTEKDMNSFVDFLLSGRYFKHFEVGYDYYNIENWDVEDVFYDKSKHVKYPQDGDYVGRVSQMSVANILDRFGHLMTTRQQEAVGNYWNQSEDYTNRTDTSIKSSRNLEQKVFPQTQSIPFHNYYEHKAITSLEDATGIPLNTTTLKNAEGEDVDITTFTPRIEGDNDFRWNLSDEDFADIYGRTDLIRVTEVYWKSYKRLGVLVYRDSLGVLGVELTTDDLLSDFLKDNEIKKVSKVSLAEMQTALKQDRLAEYENTITYIYTPEVWRGIKIKGNGSTLDNDLYLDVRPLDYQIKGGLSNIYDVKLPVSGIIDVGIAHKIVPWQQLHNVCMNQITEFLEKELGVIYTFDVTALPEELTDETTEERILRLQEGIRDTQMLALDASRQNTQGNVPIPNLFQRQDLSLGSMMAGRQQLAEYYKQEAFARVGITPQMLGQPIAYQTREGVKQGAQASYALLIPIFDKMNEAKSRELEIHLAVAQWAQVNGKDNRRLFGKGDGQQRFLDIMEQDGELFPLRTLGVVPMLSADGRKIVEQMQGLIFNDNTMEKSIKDAFEILTNPTTLELKEIVDNIEKRNEEKVQQQRQFEQQQLQTQLQADAQQKQAERQHEINLERIKGDYKLRSEQIQAYGRSFDNQNTGESDLLSRIEETVKQETDNQFRQNDLNLKEREIERKAEHDKMQKSIAERKLDQKDRELELRDKDRQVDREIAYVNKP